MCITLVTSWRRWTDWWTWCVCPRWTFSVFAMLDAFRANENGASPLPLTANSDRNGYWKRLAGLSRRFEKAHFVNNGYHYLMQY